MLLRKHARQIPDQDGDVLDCSTDDPVSVVIQEATRFCGTHLGGLGILAVRHVPKGGTDHRQNQGRPLG